MALRAIRRLTDAAIVLKRGARGCVIFPHAIPTSLEDGIVCRGFAVEVFNVVGAGDGFMSGFLYGWLHDEPWETCGRLGNACGALVVSRHGCSPASPTHRELEWFLANDALRSDLYRDPELAFIHRATTRRRRPASLRVVGCDIDPTVTSEHWRSGRTPSRFQVLAATALAGAGHAPNTGMLVDARHGLDALYALGSTLEWIGKRIDVGSTPPLQLDEGQPAGVTLTYWPRHLIACCRVPRAAGTAAAVQSERLRELFLACQHHGHELLLEPTGFTGAITSADLETRIDELLEGGVRPDWWLVPWVHDPEGLEAIAAAVVHRDRYCRGILLADPAHAGRGGAEAPSLPQHPLFSGFVLRQRVASLAGDWLCGKLDDSTLQHALCQLLSSATEQWALVA